MQNKGGRVEKEIMEKGEAINRKKGTLLVMLSQSQHTLFIAC
jgi:hypothetical protein